MDKAIKRYCDYARGLGSPSFRRVTKQKLIPFSQENRCLIEAHYIDRVATREIAEKMDVSTAALGGKISAARRALWKCLYPNERPEVYNEKRARILKCVSRNTLNIHPGGLYSVGQLAKMFGLLPETIRGYMRSGLIPWAKVSRPTGVRGPSRMCVRGRDLLAML